MKTKEIVKTGVSIALYGADAQAETGFENLSGEDLLKPNIYIAAKDSGMLEEHPGLEPGDFLVTGIDEIYKDGITVIPVKRETKFVQKMPYDDGGKFVEAHDPHSEFVQDNFPPGTFGTVKLDDGTEIKEVRYMYVIIVTDDGGLMPAVVPMGGSKLKQHRLWMTKASMLRDHVDGKRVQAPLWSRRYKLTKFMDVSKKLGKKFWNFKIEFDGGNAANALVTEEQLSDAVAFRNALETGTAKADYNDDGNTPKEGATAADIM